MTGLADLTALATAAAIRAGRVSAVEVTEAALRRAEERGPAVGAFAFLAPERALAEARLVDRQVRDGAAEGRPLLGVPCPIKDLNPVAGVGFEAGSATLRGTIAEVDDGIVEWLREAGTVMLGKTSTPEFGFPCYTEPDGRPPARTPWDLRRSAGGSSGGAAAAVAAGIVPLAQASDGGGSIRIPAAACGLVGLKPSRGRVSAGPLMVPGPGLGTAGVLSRDVADTAAALDVLAGYRVGDTYLAPAPAEGFLAATRRRPRPSAPTWEPPPRRVPPGSRTRRRPNSRHCLGASPTSRRDRRSSRRPSTRRISTGAAPSAWHARRTSTAPTASSTSCSCRGFRWTANIRSSAGSSRA